MFLAGAWWTDAHGDWGSSKAVFFNGKVHFFYFVQKKKRLKFRFCHQKMEYEIELRILLHIKYNFPLNVRLVLVIFLADYMPKGGK